MTVNDSGRRLKVGDARQPIDSTTPGHAVFPSPSVNGRAKLHTLMVAARNGAASGSQRNYAVPPPVKLIHAPRHASGSFRLVIKFTRMELYFS